MRRFCGNALEILIGLLGAIVILCAVAVVGVHTIVKFFTG
jgi:hypothetical protein